MEAPPIGKQSKVKGKENAARKFIIVLNNYTDDELQRIENRESWPEWLRYLEYELEHVDEEGKTPHVQGWCCTWDPVRVSAFKKWLRRAHIEIMHQNMQASKDYCNKEGNKKCIGEPPAQGFRTDIVGIKRRLDAGESLANIVEDEQCFSTVTKNERAFKNYAELQRKKKLRAEGRKKPEVHIIYGDSGVQKSPGIYDKYGYDNVFSCPDLTGKWFDGYAGEPVVLFDDVKEGNVFSITLFKRLCDGFPQQLPVKGGFTWFRPDAIYITSNHAPSMWWTDISYGEDWKAFQNRVWTTTNVKRIDGQVVPTVEYKNMYYYPDCVQAQ